ncbi:MAG: InlB B-repeat-containing protein [Blautia sp.]|nr:InlB B-repeat-containing protein [Blautia sp.]
MELPAKTGSPEENGRDGSPDTGIPAENPSADTIPDTDTPADTLPDTNTPADAATDTDNPADTATDIPTELTPDTDTPADDTPTTFVVTFDVNGHLNAHGDNGEPIESIMLNKNVAAGSKLAESETPKLIDDGFVLDGWYKDQLCTDPWDYENDTVTSDITLYAKWTAVYTVTFNLSGLIDAEVTDNKPLFKNDIREGSKLIESEMPIPVHKEFFFEGWFKDEWWTKPWDFENDTVTENLTLYAAWSLNCTVTFDLLGHGVKEDANGNKIEKIEKKNIHSGYLLEQTDDLKPTEDGWNFEGWYKDRECTQIWDFKEDYVTEDMTLYAKWVEVLAGMHVVTFDLSGLGLNFFQYIQTDGKIEQPDPPAVFGYSFVNWYKDAAFTTPWNFDTDTVTANVTLYAKWEERFYDVTFQSAHGSGFPRTKQIREGGYIEKSADLNLEPVEAGFSFEGWYKDEAFTQIWDFEQDTVLGPTTLYAKWLALYTVTFNLSGKGADVVVANVKEGSLLAQSEAPNPTVDGFHLDGWYKDAECTQLWDFYTDTVQSNITLYAKWIDLDGVFVVTFDLREHGMNFYDYVEAGSLLERPQDPTDDGYFFLDWYANEDDTEKWEFEKDTVTENMTLYAKWKEIPTLRIDPVESLTYTGKALKPAVSVYIGTEESQTLLKANKDYKITYKNNKDSNAAVMAKEQQEGGSWQEEDTIEGGSSVTGEKVPGGFNPLLPYVLIEGKGNYEGKLYVNFVISQVVIGKLVTSEGGTESYQEAAGITLKYNDQIATGSYKSDQKTITSLKYKTALKEGVDYTASIEGATDTNGSIILKSDPIFDTEGSGGDLTLTINGIGNYTGTIIKTIRVDAKNSLMKNVKISLGSKCKSKVFDKEAGAVTLTPAWQETVSEEKTNSDGEIIYDKNDNPVMVKKTYYYQYIEDDWRTASYFDDYDENDNLIKGKLDKNNAYTVKQGNKWLKYGEDFTVSYLNNTGTGTATMILTGIGEYSGTKSVTFKITGKAFNASTVIIATDEDGNGWVSKMTYDGTEKTQSVTLETKKRTKVYDCGYEKGDVEEDAYEDNNGNWHNRRHHTKDCEFHEEIDHVFDPDEYTVTYTNNVKCGTATAIFTAKPNSGYQGSFKKTFKIVGIDMARYVTFEGGGETLTPKIDEKEVSTGKKDEYGETIMKIVEVVETTRQMETTQPYAKAGVTLDFRLYGNEDSENPLILNRDYTVKYSNNKKITPYKNFRTKEEDDWDDNGKVTEWHWEDNWQPDPAKMGTLTITGKGNYSGKMIIKYQITQGTLDTNNAQIEVARSEYNPKTSSYKPKVTVKTDRDGTLSSSEYSVSYSNNTKQAVQDWLDPDKDAPAPTVTVTFKKSSNYENLSGDDYEPITRDVPMEFYDKKLTANNLYIIIDNDNPRDLIYTGSQVTNVSVRVYYGDQKQVKQAKKDKVTNHRLLTAPVSENSAGYGLTLLHKATDKTTGDYQITYGANNTVGKNKGSITITGLGGYGSSVTQKFTIYKSPVSYQVTPLAEPEE